MARRKKKVNDAGAGAGAGETSKQSKPGIKTPEPLKPEPKIMKKSPGPSNNTAKNSKGNEKKPENANNVYRNKGKHDTNKNKSKKIRRKDRTDESSKEKIGGMVFMCTSKTKEDCYRYMVMGLPPNKKHIVARIKPGLKLFLYDFHAKLVYGMYEATSAGGMTLEPAAFGGSYPAQVRFKVHMDCFPLSEGQFKEAIMGHSGGDTIKFDPALTKHQAKKLANLFQPSTGAIVHSSQPFPIPLVPLMPIIPTMETPLLLAHPEALANARDQHSQPLSKRENTPLVPPSLSEREYRTYGWRREPQIPAPAPIPSVASALDPSHGIRDYYHPYALHPKSASYLSESDIQRRTNESEYKLRLVTEQSAIQPASFLGYSSGVPRWNESGYRASVAEADRLHSSRAANALSDYNKTRAANALSDYNKSYQQPAGTGDSATFSVSSRYTFAGPSFTYGRS